MQQANIILTGFMASGKSTVGALLASRLGYRFVDTDHLIEQRSGMSVQELFRQRGEPAFRAMEAELARELGSGKGMVISTGGGLMVDPANARALGASGRVFCLVATPAEILHRVTTDTASCRPLLQSPDPQARIESLLAERTQQYSRFRQLDTTGKTPEEVVERLLETISFPPETA